MKLKVSFLRENILPARLRTQVSSPASVTCTCWRYRSDAAAQRSEAPWRFDDPWVSLPTQDIPILWFLLADFIPQPGTGMGDLEAQKAGPQLRQNLWHPIKSQTPPPLLLCQTPLTGNVTEPLQPHGVLLANKHCHSPGPAAPTARVGLGRNSFNGWLRKPEFSPSLPTNSSWAPLTPSLPPGAGKQPSNTASLDLHR